MQLIALRKFLFALLLCVINFVLLTGAAKAVSVPVELVIPQTQISVQGRASPNAFVTISESGIAITTTTADNNGDFVAVIVRPAGLHTIEVRYKDQGGALSQINTQTVSVQPQQTKIHNVFLSPTISGITGGLVVNGSVLQFRGYTYPNSLVSLRIDYGAKKYETVSDTNGFYEYLIDSAEIGDGVHSVNAITTNGASASDVSKNISFEITSETSPSAPDITVRPSQLPPPVAQSPEDGAIIDSDRVTIYGESVPNAQINIYENNIQIGSTFSDEFGKWSFDYYARYSPVTLSFEACINGRCSVMSKTLTLIFSKINKACTLNFELEKYRFYDVSIDELIQIVPTNIVSDGYYEINWGDTTIERFSKEDLTSTIDYAYKNKGNYNGTIIYKSVDKDDCSQIRYFSVLVDEESNKNRFGSYIWLALLILGLLLVNYMVSKDKENYTVQS